ncbi:FdrA family protein [Streptosporangium nondiastaticum]|uniref:FdrA family protein n=1 Tax=Streptosporangium nondiastaticum TaxID=35764 RepID=UPI0031F86AAA
MSVDLVRVRAGAYHDSVTLMRVSRTAADLPGVEVALVAMATGLNRGVAADLGFGLPEAGPGDLLVALRGEDPAALETAAAELDRLLAGLASRTAGGGDGGPAGLDGPGGFGGFGGFGDPGGFGGAAGFAPRTVGAAARALAADPGPALALVSVPGPYAFTEAMDAIEAGLPVMIFSDNVPVEQEVLLKRRAAERDVLVMGPDCGTAVIGGTGLGFANVLRPGPVGMVAASGTGAQQVACLLDLAGVGVRHVLGVGGRDLSAEVGGLSTLRALAALDADPATELIVLVSKPPAPEVARTVRDAAAGLATPVVSALLGPGSGDLTAAAESALRALGVPAPAWPSWPAPGPAGRKAGDGGAREPGDGTGEPGGAATAPPATAEAGGPTGSGGTARRNGAALHGLYAGGTLCAEARLVAGAGRFTDFGDDAYTRGRAHPMIDPTLRLEALAGVPGGDVALLDVVLGHGADPDPARRLAPAVAAAVARGTAVVVTLVGTEGDPQGLGGQTEALRAAGAAVFASNARAARHAAALAAGAR